MATDHQGHPGQERAVAPHRITSRPVSVASAATLGDEALRWWRLGGDTHSIALRLHEPEHKVERALHAALDSARNARTT